MAFKVGFTMRIILVFLSLISSSVYADTINNYMNIVNNIPQMEMKADQQAQAWARSARHVITITCESIAETMLQANQAAQNAGKPIFCLPVGVSLNAPFLNDLIQQTYRDLSSQQSDKDKMTVSQIAWLGVGQKYPCDHNAVTNGVAQMASAVSVAANRY